MTNETDNKFDRRRFLKSAGGLAAYTAAAGLLSGTPLKKVLSPISVADAAVVTTPPDLFYAGTDGWISLPASPTITTLSEGLVHPDPLAPPGFTTYMFGFRNVTGLTSTQMAAQKLKTQHSAPIFYVDEFTGNNEFKMDLTNLGLGMRPDLVDSHTIHWHGFRNVIPYFDGEPLGSVAVTINRVFRYIFRPKDPGTYMFHCHVEDIEHVHMGMTGLVYVRPKQNKTGASGAPVARLGGNSASTVQGYAYNDGVALTDPTSTHYHREFVMLMTEVWATSHWCDAHIQLPEWSEYRPDFSLLNGRCYPDTLAPNAPSIDPFNPGPGRDGTGDLIAPAGNPHLQYQPYSSVVTCKSSERVLLRFVNLGYRESAMTIAGIDMKVVGKDATPMRGINPANGLRDTGGADTSYITNTVALNAGESIDAIFVAPAFSGGTGSSGLGYDVYELYNRAYDRSGSLAGDAAGYAGQRTEVRVYPSTFNLPNQAHFNDRAGV